MTNDPVMIARSEALVLSKAFDPRGHRHVAQWSSPWCSGWNSGLRLLAEASCAWRKAWRSQALVAPLGLPSGSSHCLPLQPVHTSQLSDVVILALRREAHAAASGPVVSLRP